MEKNMRDKHGCGPIQNHPGFIWGLFNILKQNHWRYIKKRLPHKRLLGRIHVVGARNPGNSSKASNNYDSQAPQSSAEVKKSVLSSRKLISSLRSIVVDQLKTLHSEENSKKPGSEERAKKHNSEKKSKKPNSEAMHSVKARIKAFITEDKSKKKGRHHRSSTYPVQSNSSENNPLQQLEFSGKDPLKDELSTVFNQMGKTSPAIGALNPLFLVSEELSSSDSDENDALNNHPDRNRKISHENNTENDKKKDKKALFDPSLLHAKELAENDDTSPRQSKSFLDALSLINMNKKFLLRVLREPDSPLAQHFQSQQALSAKMVLTKARSFPAPMSSAKGTFYSTMHKHDENEDAYEKRSAELEPAEHFCKQEKPLIAAEYRVDGIQKLNEATLTVRDDNSPGSGHHMWKPGTNLVVVKRFKDLRQKIRHAIKESKDERHRITMDAVLHKVPHKYGFSKDLRQEIIDWFKEPPVNRSRKGLKLKHMRRTSSLCGSLDRYLQFYECSFNKETEKHMSENLQSRTEAAVLPSRRGTKGLGRILSLPEMKYYFHKRQDSPICPENHFGGLLNLSSLDEQEQESMDAPKALEEHSESHLFLDDKETTYFLTEYNKASVDKDICDGLKSLKGDTELPLAQKIEAEITSSGESKEESPCLEPDFTFEANSVEFPFFQEDSELNIMHPFEDHQQEFGMAANTTSDEFSTSQHSQTKLMHDVHVDAKDEPKFNYVRNVLELTGFSSSESRVIWHNDHQPVDPIVYEEVTGCMLDDPECSGNHGGNCNHLLLFDTVNEVLMEIYERCYHYWPMPLTFQCRIHPMPVGYIVLKEVWVKLSWYLKSKHIEEWEALDYLMSRDLCKEDGRMNLQYDSECVGIEVEDLIFDGLLEELMLD